MPRPPLIGKSEDELLDYFAAILEQDGPLTADDLERIGDIENEMWSRETAE